MFNEITIRGKLTLLTATTVVGFVVFGLVSFGTLSALKVNGPQYQRIVQGKDLVADVLSPAEYIIEPYLVLFQMVDEGDKARIEEMVEKSKALRASYERRHEFWARQLPEGPLKQAMVDRSYRPAMEFFEIP